jgi:hypothetical protein
MGGIVPKAARVSSGDDSGDDVRRFRGRTTAMFA